jgi:hypothetical protein
VITPWKVCIASSLLLCCAGVAGAEDTNIRVEYVIRQERVRPQPQTVRPKITLRLALRANGKVDVVSDVPGKTPQRLQGSDRLGTFLKVVNERTLVASWSIGRQHRKLTINTDAEKCTAMLDITGSREFEALSTDLNQMALYRDPVVESITCEIK